MKEYIEERAVEAARYIIEQKATVRQAAKKMGISKSTVRSEERRVGKECRSRWSPDH